MRDHTSLWCLQPTTKLTDTENRSGVAEAEGRVGDSVRRVLTNLQLYKSVLGMKWTVQQLELLILLLHL